MKRCINIDWLEVYCLESANGFPHDAEYFMRKGYFVKVRDYGTRQYNQMFTILDEHDRPFVEVRRDPVASGSAMKSGIFSPYSCHLRLSNVYCYADNAIQLFSEFLMQHDYEVQRIFRLDLCLDFEKFDSGDDPNAFMRRYMEGRYTKINQGHIAAHGHDTWEQRCWNSLSWGAPKSMVSTKFYCKSLELREAKDKPYIRYAWFQAGLVDDWDALTKRDESGNVYQPTIWRVEFSIKSSARAWFILEDCNGKKQRQVRKPHHLGTYAEKADQLKAFAMLAYHYFHFKHYEAGVRKDRCKDKMLFDFGNHEIYKLDRLMTDKPKDTSLQALMKRIEHYRETHFDDAVRRACDTLLKQLKSESVRNALPMYDATEAKLLEILISYRLKGDRTTSIEDLEQLLKLSEQIF